MQSYVIIEAVVTAARLNGAAVDRQEVEPDQFANLEYDVEGRTNLEGVVQLATFTGRPFRPITTINLLTAKVGTPCCLRWDAGNLAEPFRLFDVQEEFLFEDCEGGVQPGGRGTLTPIGGA